MRDSARFHFGFTVPFVPHMGAGAVIAAVAASKGDLGLLPAVIGTGTPAELRAARKPITASDEHTKPQTGATQAKRKPPDIVAHRAAQRRGGGFRYVRE